MLRMATAMVMQMRRNVGFMFRESGQAMERLGMSMMGDYSYMEPRECYCLPPNDAVHCLLAHLGVGNAAATPFFCGRLGFPCGGAVLTHSSVVG